MMYWVLTSLALNFPAASWATPVTVTVTTKAGGEPAVDTVLIFDPLDASPPASRADAVIDQVDKKFVPRVSVIRTGTAVRFPNSDHIRHQVYSFSKPKIFTLKLYAGSPREDVKFDVPGLVVLGCNIHDSMVAFVGVVDTPYFAKLDASGHAVLDLPDGHYKLRIWHPDMVVVPAARPLTVAGQPLPLALTVELDPARGSVADWPE